MNKISHSESVYNLRWLLMWMQARTRVRSARLVANGLEVTFAGQHIATIPVDDLDIFGGKPAVKFVGFSPWFVEFGDDKDQQIKFSSDLLWVLSLPGGKQAVERELRGQFHVVGASLRWLRSNLGKSIATLSRETDLPEHFLTEVENDHPVSEWDLYKIGRALDAYLPDIIDIQAMLKAKAAS